MADSIDELEKAALGIVLSRGVVGGEELMAKTRKTDVELFKAMKELTRIGVVNCNTPLSSPETVRNAYFNLQPSMMGLAKDLISR
jgi:hypothetical protein